jgi:hypothetical protein
MAYFLPSIQTYGGQNENSISCWVGQWPGGRMKNLLLTILYVVGAVWLLMKSEGAPAIQIPIFSAYVLAIPIFLFGAYLTFTGKKPLIGIAIMFVVAAVFVGGAK